MELKDLIKNIENIINKETSMPDAVLSDHNHMMFTMAGLSELRNFLKVLKAIDDPESYEKDYQERLKLSQEFIDNFKKRSGSNLPYASQEYELTQLYNDQLSKAKQIQHLVQIGKLPAERFNLAVIGETRKSEDKIQKLESQLPQYIIDRVKHSVFGEINE